MTFEEFNKLRQIASEEAEQWFTVQQESLVPDLDPDDTTWQRVNSEFPGNGNAAGVTLVDRVFENFYRNAMAKKWAAFACDELFRLATELKK